MRRTYNQKNNSLTVAGVTIQDFFEGASIVVTLDGGEVEKTQGADGASVNIATNQGITIQFTLRETSRSMNFLTALRKTQENGGPGVPFVFRSGGGHSVCGIQCFHQPTRPALHRRQETGRDAIHVDCR